MSTCTADGKAQPHRRCMTPSACYVVFLSSHRRWMLSHRRCMSCSGVACDIHCHSVALRSVREPFARNWTSNFARTLLNVPRQTKATSMASQGVPKWSKGCPKGPKRSSKSTKDRKRGSNGTQRRPINHNIYICIHTLTKYM